MATLFVSLTQGLFHQSTQCLLHMHRWFDQWRLIVLGGWHWPASAHQQQIVGANRLLPAQRTLELGALGHYL
jgi:hypothetical protein